ncbi:MAG: DUF1761 family protein [Candidatus Marinimicrobia bacterium]|nr:DUF1761 family protein [Candidatus Neomarinimicrobiota bacterium]
MFDFSIQIWPFLIGAIIPTIIGMFWYSPLLFGNQWMNAIGINSNDIKDSGASASGGYTISLIMSIVLSYAMGVLVHSLNISSGGAALLFGAAVWFAFNFYTFAKLIFFEDRPLALIWIGGGYDILCFSLIAFHYALWS